MNILIIKYLPAGNKSKTKELLDYYKSVTMEHNVEEMDY